MAKKTQKIKNTDKSKKHDTKGVVKSAKKKDETFRDLMKLLKPYWKWVLLMLIVVLASNSLNLIVPTLVARAIDSYEGGNYDFTKVFSLILGISIGLFSIANFQVVISTFVTEKVAFDLRNTLSTRLSKQSYSYVNKTSGSSLLTNFTSDVDAVKEILTQAVVNIVSAIILIIGSIILMLRINVVLTLQVLVVIPFIIVAFAIVFGQLAKLFTKIQENVDSANKTISETIAGAAIIRVLHTEKKELTKYNEVNEISKSLGLQILNRFGAIIPIINFLASTAILIIIWFGGNKVINDEMTVGGLTAFMSYLNILIFPIIMIGFLSSMIARAVSSFERINKVLKAPIDDISTGEKTNVKGEIEFNNVSLKIGRNRILKDLSFKIHPNTDTAILGPTAAGKTMIFYLMTGLLKPTKGTILFDGKDITILNKEYLFSQIGFVFQENILFNDSLKENITLGLDISEEDVKRAIETSELFGFVESLDKGLDTQINERGTNMSGGQKQRMSLARALAAKPKVLLLDDFTARVDLKTEKKIFQNINENYPDLTKIVISQKISSVEFFDQIILIMEGELIGTGKHDDLMKSSIEYRQIFRSQQSLNGK